MARFSAGHPDSAAPPVAEKKARAADLPRATRPLDKFHKHKYSCGAHPGQSSLAGVSSSRHRVLACFYLNGYLFILLIVRQDFIVHRHFDHGLDAIDLRLSYFAEHDGHPARADH